MIRRIRFDSRFLKTETETEPLPVPAMVAAGCISTRQDDTNVMEQLVHEGRLAYQPIHRCPVSGEICEDYRDCDGKNYCWLK